MKRDLAADKPFIKFLGTAGARFVVAKQLRSSGGIFIAACGQKVILDPGPGTIVRCASSRPPIDPAQLDAVILTHAHIDHSNDVNILIDAMTAGGLRKRGTLFAPAECLTGKHAVVLRYVKGFLEKIVPLEPSKRYHSGELTFATSVPHLHSAETYGLKFEIKGRKIAFLVDTKFFPGLLKSYRGADILVINVVRDTPFENKDILHLSLEDVRTLVAGIRPRQAILTHFGMMMLRAKPWQTAARLTEELGIEVVAASDGMTVTL